MRKIFQFVSLLLAAWTSSAFIAGQSQSGNTQVNLTWQAPVNSPDPIVGYNIYRSPSGASSFAIINAAEIPSSTTAYSDPTVIAGQSYDYVIECVDAAGVQSGPSNVATVAAVAGPTVAPPMNLQGIFVPGGN